MIRYHHSCAAEVFELNRSVTSVRKDRRQYPRLLETADVSSKISPLVASKVMRRSERFSKGFLNRLIMTTVCDSPFRLPYCTEFPEMRQNLGKGNFPSCFTKAVKINPKLELVVLDLRNRCGLKAFSSSATI